MRLAIRMLCLLPLLASLFGQEVTRSCLRVLTPGQAAECPLRHTAVKADISGMVARVNVVQEFQNTLAEKIEAVYTFPLPHGAAVDSMTMTVGNRVISGKVKPREEARAIYQAARDAGRVASLLDRERPNIFAQSVANIEPGAAIRIEIAYVETLEYEAGRFEFVFPMVVAPRYIPASVNDAHRITPPLVPEGMRAGHDISLEVTLDAGVPIGHVGSPSHPVDVLWASGSSATVRLKDQQTIPNKDFVLRYESASGTIQDGVLAHRSAKGGYFAVILEPPAKIGARDAAPKELIFVLDTSGSMMGFPIEKAKEAMQLALDGLSSQDTFNLITFSGDTEILFPEPVPATPENLAMARLFLNSRSGDGGTEMMKAIRAALEPTVGSGRVRVVCFMTDGEVGNDMEILAEVQKHADARVFAFGIGQSVNRFLLDGMAQLGRGEVEYVGLQDDGSAAARRFHQRVRDPLLTDLSIDWGGLAVSDVYPKRIPDLFGAKPVVVVGRYAGPLHGRIELRGKAGTYPVMRQIALDLPAADAGHDALASLWAQRKVADLSSQDYAGLQRGAIRQDLKQQITQLGLDYGVATEFTSFVAVEEQTVTTGGKARRIEVPVNMPEGMSYAAFGGARVAPAAPRQFGAGRLMTPVSVPKDASTIAEAEVPPASRGVGGVGGGVSGGVAGGTPGGVLGGIIGSVPSAAPPPPPPPPSVVPPPLARQARVYRGMRPPSEPADPTGGKLDPALATLARESDAAALIEVRVLLRDASSATLDALRALGFTMSKAPGRDLQATGRIAAGKLLELARLAAVRFVVKTVPPARAAR
jgi:Ca-activated chloride channel family protein